MPKWAKGLFSKEGLIGFLIILLRPIHDAVQWAGEVDFIADNAASFLAFLETGPGFTASFVAGCAVIGYGIFKGSRSRPEESAVGASPSAEKQATQAQPRLIYTAKEREERYEAWSLIGEVLTSRCTPVYAEGRSVGNQWRNQIINIGVKGYAASMLDFYGHWRDSLQEISAICTKYERFPDMGAWFESSSTPFRKVLEPAGNLLKDKLKRLDVPPTHNLVDLLECYAEDYRRGISLYGEWLTEAKKHVVQEIKGLS